MDHQNEAEDPDRESDLNFNNAKNRPLMDYIPYADEMGVFIIAYQYLI